MTALECPPDERRDASAALRRRDDSEVTPLPRSLANWAIGFHRGLQHLGQHPPGALTHDLMDQRTWRSLAVPGDPSSTTVSTGAPKSACLEKTYGEGFSVKLLSIIMALTRIRGFRGSRGNGEDIRWTRTASPRSASTIMRLRVPTLSRAGYQQRCRSMRSGSLSTRTAPSAGSLPGFVTRKSTSTQSPDAPRGSTEWSR